MGHIDEYGDYRPTKEDFDRLEAERDKLRAQLEEADAGLRGTVTGMQGAIDEIKGERDKLAAGLEKIATWCDAEGDALRQNVAQAQEFGLVGLTAAFSSRADRTDEIGRYIEALLESKGGDIDGD